MPNFIAIDHRSGVPLYRQIIDQILIAISTGALPPNAQLPTVRKLAIDTRLNPNTIARAYRELEIRGIVKTQRGTGTFVAGTPHDARKQALQRAQLDTYCDAIITEAAKKGFSLPVLVEALQERLADRR